MILKYKDLIRKLSDAEFSQLEKNILKDGILDPLVFWGDILIDGHHRLKIAKKHNLKYDTKHMDFKNEDEVKIWIIDKQLGQRNLSDFGKFKLLEMKSEIWAQEGREKQGTRTDLIATSAIKSKTTNDKIAKELKWGTNKVAKAQKISKVISDEVENQLFNNEITINEIYNNIKKEERKVIENEKQKNRDVIDFKPFLYNIWSINRGDNKDYFGHFPEIFMDNLIYYHTQKDDLIFDPFSGSGTTVDVCNRWQRKYYCSDINPTRTDIKKHDISTGFPEDLPKVDLLFLDPPYWLQAKDKYLSNKFCAKLEDFNSQIKNILDEACKRKIQTIAIVISPTQIPNNWTFTDHIFEFHKMLCNNYKIKMRYQLPYSTEQYNGNTVIKAKELKITLNLNRDLVIWDLKTE